MLTYSTASAPFDLSPAERLWIYNGMDACITREIFDKLLPQLDSTTSATYRFSRELQAPVLEMNLRGILIDIALRNRVVADLEKQLLLVEAQFNALLQGCLDLEPMNWNSPIQMLRLFYDHLCIPTIYSRKHGEAKITVDVTALEKICAYFHARPFALHVMFLRDLKKKIQVLKSGVDPDNRIRTSHNIAGTETGRFSSSENFLGTGTNLQNITDEVRQIFISDPGLKFGYADLEQGESRAVGAIVWNLFGDGQYLDACESGDLHTTVCKMVWPDFGWSSDDAENKERASSTRFWRHLSYRDFAKRISHGSNYNGTPAGISLLLGIERGLIEKFQQSYFTAFPGIRRWHHHVSETLSSKGCLTTLTGRRRYFLGRRNDDATLREAIAYEPQDIVARITNNGLLQVWRAKICQVLLQVHDAFLVQLDEGNEPALVQQILTAARAAVQLKQGRTFEIPLEMKTGWNWSTYNETNNPDGLKKWQGIDTRKRTVSPEMPLLDRGF